MHFEENYRRKGELELQEWFGMGRAEIVNRVTREGLAEKMTWAKT